MTETLPDWVSDLAPLLFVVTLAVPVLRYDLWAIDTLIRRSAAYTMSSSGTVVENMLRIGRRAIISFPNFGHWRIRLQLLLNGAMPVTDNLPDSWYDSPNIHFCTIKDFRDLCRDAGVKVEKSVALNAWGAPLRLNAPWWFWNLFGEQAVFLLTRKG